jgi:hypothetical protein
MPLTPVVSSAAVSCVRLPHPRSFLPQDFLRDRLRYWLTDPDHSSALIGFRSRSLMDRWVAIHLDEWDQLSDGDRLRNRPTNASAFGDLLHRAEGLLSSPDDARVRGQVIDLLEAMAEDPDFRQTRYATLHASPPTSGADVAALLGRLFKRAAFREARIADDFVTIAKEQAALMWIDAFTR